MNHLDLEQLISASDKLSEEEKITLIEYLLKDLPLNKQQVIFSGGNFIKANNVFQIQSGEIIPLVQALASFMKKEKPFEN
jgi:lipase chaperone LimK